MRRFLPLLVLAAATGFSPAHADSSCIIEYYSTPRTCTYTTAGRSQIVSEVTQMSSWVATVKRDGLTIVVAHVPAPNNGLPSCQPVLARPNEDVTITYTPGGVVPAGAIVAVEGDQVC